MAALPMVEETDGSSIVGLVRLENMGLGMVLTHCNDVGTDSVSKRKVASDGDEDVKECCRADTSDYYSGGSQMRVVGDFVEDGEHLVGY